MMTTKKTWGPRWLLVASAVAAANAIGGIGCSSDDAVGTPAGDAGAADGTANGTGTDAGATNTGNADTGTGGSCKTACSATKKCFPATSSCVCTGGRTVQFDNCVNGCCSELGLMEKCDLACQ